MMFNNINLSSETIDNSNTIWLEQQHDTSLGGYIEIPNHIKNFAQLQEDECFDNIKSQYTDYINKFPELYYHFTGLKNNNLNIIINTINSIDNTYIDKTSLFYSFKVIRKHVYNIITYLTECKELHISNDKTAIVCTQITECFGVCFDGFNSKILRIGNYISSCNSIAENINYKIKCFVEETIDNLLLKYQRRINIHEKNALFNMAAVNLNFDYIQDKYANLNDFDDYSIKDLIYEFNIALSGFNICKIIVNELYVLFKDVITKTGKEQWFDNYIDDITAEFIFYLEDNFINVVNQYLDIELDEDKLSIHNLMGLTEADKIYITDVKDRLHLLCAKYIHKTLKLPKFLNCENKIITSIKNKAAIFSINNRYFYVLENNKTTTPLQLNHLELINPYCMELAVYVPILMQALEQTFSTKAIYSFFNHFQNYILLFFSTYSYYICQELNKILRQNTDIRNRVLSALLEPHLKKDIITDKICKKFISNNIIANELLKHLFVNKIDISSYLANVYKQGLLNFITSLDIVTIENIFLKNDLYNPILVNKVKSILFYLFLAKRWSLITALLQSKIKFYFIESLTNIQKKKALTLVLNNKQYDIAEYFLLSYVQLNITDYNKNNIIHNIILGNSLILLKTIVNNIRSDLLHKLLLAKNKEGLTPLTMAMLLASNIDYFNTILSHCNDDILSVTSKGNNAIMLAAKEGCDQCLHKLIAKTSKYNLLTNSNKYGYNSLMLAIQNKHDCSADIILNNISITSLTETENFYGFTPLHLAIKYNSGLIDKLISKADHKTLRVLSYSLDSILSLAVQANNEHAIELILQKCDKSILHEKNYRSLNPLMIAANMGYLGCLKKLFKYSDKNLLTKKNRGGNNILMLAVKNARIDCIDFIVKNCPKTTLKKLYRQTNNIGYDVLSIARYCSVKPIYLKDNQEFNIEAHKKILSFLYQYKP